MRKGEASDRGSPKKNCRLIPVAKSSPQTSLTEPLLGLLLRIRLKNFTTRDTDLLAYGFRLKQLQPPLNLNSNFGIFLSFQSIKQQLLRYLQTLISKHSYKSATLLLEKINPQRQHANKIQRIVFSPVKVDNRETKMLRPRIIPRIAIFKDKKLSSQDLSPRKMK